MKTNRKTLRLDLDLPILIKSFNEYGDIIKENTVTVNISSRGAYCLVKNKLPKDHNVSLTITFPSKLNNEINIKGRVAWINEHGLNDNNKIGVGFCFDSSKGINFNRSIS